MNDSDALGLLVGEFPELIDGKLPVRVSRPWTLFSSASSSRESACARARASAISISVGGLGNANSICEVECAASLVAVTKLSAWRLSNSSSSQYSSSIYASASGSESALPVIVGIVATVDFLGRKGGPVPFVFMVWEGCGPGKAGVRLRGGIVGGGSVDLVFVEIRPARVEEDVETCVREEVWEVVRLSCREMNGWEME
jgi:hypothetical protein